MPTDDRTAPALLLNGLDQAVYLGTASELGLTNASFTVEAWIRPDELRPGFMAVLGTDETGSSCGLHLVLRDGRPYLGFYGDDLAAERVQVPAGEWTHLAWRYDSNTREQAILVNGIPIAQRRAQDHFRGGGGVRLGRYAGVSSFRGALRDVRVWGVARGDAEVLEDHNRVLAGDEPGLTAWWPLDEGSGERARNAAERASYALLRGGVIMDSPRLQPPSESWVLALSNPGDQLVAEAFRWPSTATAVTVEWWMKLAEADLADATLLRVGTGDAPGRFSVHVDAATRSLRWEYGDEAQGRLSALLDGRLGRWLHVAVVSGGDGLGPRAIYFDGALAGEAEGSSSPGAELAGLTLGTSSEEPPLRVRLRELRIWSAARSVDDIEGARRRRAHGAEDSLAACYSLRGGRAGADLGPRGYHARRLGGAAWVEDNALPSSLGSAGTPDLGSPPILLPALDLREGSGFTVEFWVLHYQNGFKLEWPGDAANGGRARPLRVSFHHPYGYDNGYRFECLDNSSELLDDTYATWTHIAMVQSDAECVVYRDGAVVSRTSKATDRGLWVWGRGSISVGGSLTELRVWTEARGEGQIRRGMHSRCRGDEDHLIMALRLDEGAGAGALDYAARDVDAAAQGRQIAVWRERRGDVPSPDAASFLRGMPDSPGGLSCEVDLRNPITIEEWVLCAANRSPDLWEIRDGTKRVVSATSSRSLGRVLWPNTGQSGGLGGTSYLEDGSWVHLAWVFADGTMTFYVDGVPRDRRDFQLNPPGWGPMARLTFAASDQAEARVWSCARSEAEIRGSMTKHLGSAPHLLYVNIGTKIVGRTLAGASIALLGAAEGIAVEPSPALQITRDQTLELWLANSRSKGETRLIGKAWGAEGSLSLKGDTLVYKWGELDGNRGNESQTQTVTYRLPQARDRWRHIALVRSWAGVWLFVDGVGVVTEDTNRFRFSTGRSPLPWQIGPYDPAPTDPVRIADVRLWNVARTKEQIKANMSPTARLEDPGLVGRWLVGLPHGPVHRRVLPFRAPARDSALVPARAWIVDRVTSEPRLARAARVSEAAHLCVDPMTTWPDQAWSLELWVRTESTAPLATIVSYWSEGLSLELAGPAGLCLHLGDEKHVSDAAIHDGEWHHLCIQWCAEEGLVLLVDGARRLVHRWSRRLHAGGALVLGQSQRAQGVPEPDRALLGELAEVRLWSVFRDDEVVQADALRRPAVAEPGLIGWWPLARGIGDVAPDRVGGQHAVFYPANWVRPGAHLSRRPALRFDGPDRVEVPDLAGFNALGRITVEAWVRPAADAPAREGAPVVSRLHEARGGWELRVGRDGADFLCSIAGSWHSVRFEVSAVERWIHVAAAYDGAQLVLYVNGVAVDAKAVTGALTPNNDRPTLGRRPGVDGGFRGQVADVRVWSVARGPQSIARSMAARLQGDEDGLLAYWKMIPVDDSAERVADSGPHHLDGVALGTEWVSTDLPVGAAALAHAARDVYSQLKDLRGQRDALRQERDGEAGKVLSLNLQVATLEGRNQELTRGVAELAAKAQRLVTLEARIGALEADLVAKERQLQEMARERGAQTSLEDLIRRANDEVSRVRTQLAGQGGSYQLGRVTLDLKMIPGPGGVGMRFLSPEEMKSLGNGQLSSLQIDLSARDQGRGSKAESGQVPDVGGYTEVIARRRLAEAGYLAEVHYQAVAVDGGDLRGVDRVVQQLPAAGDRAPATSAVLIFIGKSS